MVTFFYRLEDENGGGYTLRFDSFIGQVCRAIDSEKFCYKSALEKLLEVDNAPPAPNTGDAENDFWAVYDQLKVIHNFKRRPRSAKLRKQVDAAFFEGVTRGGGQLKATHPNRSGLVLSYSLRLENAA